MGAPTTSSSKLKAEVEEFLALTIIRRDVLPDYLANYCYKVVMKALR